MLLMVLSSYVMLVIDDDGDDEEEDEYNTDGRGRGEMGGEEEERKQWEIEGMTVLGVCV